MIVMVAQRVEMQQWHQLNEIKKQKYGLMIRDEFIISFTILFYATSNQYTYSLS